MNFDKIKKEIEKADIISFDIFDTLITRRVLHPVDIFSFVGLMAHKEKLIDFDFITARTNAEKELSCGEKKYCYNLSDIYDEIKSSCSLTDVQADRLKTLETEAEERFIIPRNDVKELFYELYNSGKKIICVSDMYLSVAQLGHLMKASGYPTDIEIFVSNENNAVKGDGSLWKKVIGKYPQKKILHIGDNRQVDYSAVKSLGQSAIHISNPFDKFVRSKLYKILAKYDNGEFGNSFLLGRLCNQILFNNAFSDEYDEEELSGLWNGSELSCFIRWLINNRDDSLLLFVTREGYIFEPLYNEYCKSAGIEPQKNCLFYASRQAVSIACASSDKDFKDLLEWNYKGTLNKLLGTRFGIDKNELSGEKIIELPHDKEFVYSYCKPFLNEITEISSKRKAVYADYISQCCDKYGAEEMTVVDLGYQGTAQCLLNKISENPVKGKYFILGDTAMLDKFGCEYSGLTSFFSGVHPIYDNIVFFESSLQVPYGQLLEICKDEDGEFVFRCNNAKQTSEYILKAQSRSIEFSKNDAEIYGVLGEKYDYSLSMAEDIWMCLLYYNLLPCEIMNHFSLDDDFGGNETWIYNPKTHYFESSISKVPFVFYKSHSIEALKQRIKNFVKDYTPQFLFEMFRQIWLRYIK